MAQGTIRSVIMKKVICILGIIGVLVLGVSYAGQIDTSTISRYSEGSQVTDVNLEGKLDAIRTVVNSGIDSTNIATGYKLLEVSGTLPSAGTQGRGVYLTSNDTFNFDTGSAFVPLVSTGGTQTITGNKTFSGTTVFSSGNFGSSNITTTGNITGGNITTTGNLSGNNVTSTGKILGSNGNASAPSYSFTSDTDTGMYVDGGTLILNIAGGTGISIGGYITINGNLLPVSNANEIGTATSYWNTVHCASVTDHSLVWADGLETLDGRKITDLEAIKMLKPSKTKSKSGLYFIEKKSFPKQVYVPASNEKGLLLRDASDIPYEIIDGKKVSFERADASDLTVVVSMLLGAVRDLSDKNDALEARVKRLEEKVK
jgi:hypothetical protein